jgi:uncharacterized protein (DUF302 family)
VSVTLARTVTAPYDETVATVRAALADQGFGVLTEIDLKATLKEKLDVEVPAEVILGACRPPLAHQAITAEPSVAALLPCNVVVRELGDGRTLVEALDPDALSRLFDHDRLAGVVADARARIEAALDAVASVRAGA